jgi:hypothetical protein
MCGGVGLTTIDPLSTMWSGIPECTGEYNLVLSICYKTTVAPLAYFLL